MKKQTHRKKANWSLIEGWRVRGWVTQVKENIVNNIEIGLHNDR